MNKIATLAKIANRLDSLGLTKEADILDGLIRKLAEEGDAPQAAGQKYIDAYGSELSALPPAKLLLELKNDLTAMGTTDSGGMFSSGITKIEAIFYYLRMNKVTYESIFSVLKYLRYDVGSFTTLNQVLDDEDAGLASKCNLAWAAAMTDYINANPDAPPAPAPTRRGPVKDWAYYIKNTEIQDGVGGQQVYDAWKRFTSSKFGFGFTSDYNSFVSWWANAPQKLYHPKQVVDALIGVIDRIPQGRVSGGSTDTQAEATRRESAISSATGEVPPASNFKTNYSD